MNAPLPQRTRPISIAILAMGGEGGGVLADWIIDLAEHNHYLAQLTSVPGVVDIVVASELMEAGRAIQRGLITPDRTTLIASTNRVFSMTERVALADGRVDAERSEEHT